MVFFVCSSCGASLKKNAVEKHWMTRCRQTKRVSCMDCSKEFVDQEYAGHIKCVTENEKYGGNQYKAKEQKGEKKQDAWVANIQEKVANTHDMDPNLIRLFEQLLVKDNIPRKKTKFMNFMHSCRVTSDRNLIEKAWEFIVVANVKQNTTNNNSSSQNQNTTNNKDDHSSHPAENLNTANNKDDHSSHPAAEEPYNTEPSFRREKKMRMKNKNKYKNVGKDRPNEKINVEGGQDATLVSRKEKKKKHVVEQPMDTEVQKESTTLKGGKLKKNKKIKSCDTSLVPNGNHDEPSTTVNKLNKQKKKQKRKHYDEQPMDAETLKESTAEEEVNVKKRRKTESLNTSLIANENHNQEMTNGHNTLAASHKSFKWKVAITTILKSGPEDGLKMTKLRKKVLSLYLNSSKADVGAPKSEEELSAILTKKLNLRNDKYIIHNNKVKLKK